MGVRRPFIGQIETVTSPDDASETFDIKRCGVREQIERQNLNSTMRYVERDSTANGKELVSERDYPMGSMNVATVRLGLAGWSFLDDNQKPVPISDTTIQNYLSPKEFDFLLKKVLEINPLWAGGSEEDTETVKGN